MDLDGLSPSELNELAKEIQNKQRELKEKENEKIRIKTTEFLDKLYNADILSLIEHNRTSCSDTNVCNGYGSADYGARCNKCHLIEIMNEHSYGVHNFEVSIEVNITKIGGK
jgi:hypothetical protein